MPVEEQQLEPPANTPAGAQNTETPQPDAMIPKTRFDEINKRAKQAEQQLEALRKQAEDAEKAQLASQQQFQKLYEDEQKRAAALATEIAETKATMRRNAIAGAVETAARTAQFADPADAHRFLDLAAIELDEAGKPQGIDKLIADLAKTKPYLLTTVTPTPGNGQAPKPAGAAGDAERDAKAKRRFEQTVRSW